MYYANRSIANLRLENFGYALNDVSKAIEIDKFYTKAYYRRAAAFMSLGKYKLALKDFEYVSKKNMVMCVHFMRSFIYKSVINIHVVFFIIVNFRCKYFPHCFNDMWCSFYLCL